MRSSTNFLIVLREIEEEDSLWHRKDKKDSNSDSVQQTTATTTESELVSKTQAKESKSTVPTSPDETKTQSQPRKTRFF